MTGPGEKLGKRNGIALTYVPCPFFICLLYYGPRLNELGKYRSIAGGQIGINRFMLSQQLLLRLNIKNR